MLFYAHSDNLNIWICKDGIYFDQYKLSSVENNDVNPITELKSRAGRVIKFDFIASNFSEIINKQKSITKYNVFRTANKKNWFRDINVYNGFVLKDIYKNIDLKLYFDQSRFRYDLQLNKGADVSEIKFKIDGAMSLIHLNNDISIITELGYIYHKDLMVYQEDNYIKNQIKCDIIEDNGVYSYNIEDYNKNEQLIIDPLIYSTYLGGSSYDVGEDITVDSKRNVIIVGYSTSVNFPTKSGSYKVDLSEEETPDIIVTKFDISNNMVFSTFIGGFGGDYGRAVVCDSADNIFIAGHTNSGDFPTTENAYDNIYNGNMDAFLLKLNKDGNNLLFSTFFGSSSDDAAYGIALDTNYNPVITGSTNFAPDESRIPYTTPIFNASYKGKVDGYVSKFTNNGNQLIFSGIMGGSKDDFPQDITLDTNNNIYITGMTRSYDFPIAGNRLIDKTYNDTPNDKTKSDIFVSKISSKGSLLIYSTFLGGSGQDIAYSIEVDNDMNTYISGLTKSSDFPITANNISSQLNNGLITSEDGDAFITKINRYADSLMISSYIGGVREDKSFDLQIDEYRQIYLVGATKSSDLPTTSLAFKRVMPDTANFFDAYLMKFSAGLDTIKYATFFGGQHNDIGKALYLGKEDLVFFTGSTSSSFFPVTNDAFDLTFNDSLKTDAFYVKFVLENIEDSDYVICEGTSTILSSGISDASGNITMEYEWQPVDGLDDPTLEFPRANPEKSTQYRVKVTTSEGEELYASIIVSVVPKINTKVFGSFGVNNNDIYKYATAKHFGSSYKWTVENGQITKGQNTNEIFVKWSDGENGIVKSVETSDFGCKDSSILQTYFLTDYEMDVVEFGNYGICDGDTVVLIAGQQYYNVEWNDGTYGPYDTVSSAREVYFIATDNFGNPYKSDRATISLLEKPQRPKVLYKVKDRELLCLNKATEYTWFKDGLELYGEKNRTLKNLTAGTYYLIVTNSFGCSNKSIEIEVQGLSVSENKNVFKIYPNPVRKILNIETTQVFKGFDLRLYDNLGREKNAKIINTEGRTIQIDVSELEIGIYNLMINNIHYSVIIF